MNTSRQNMNQRTRPVHLTGRSLRLSIATALLIAGALLFATGGQGLSAQEQGAAVRVIELDTEIGIVSARYLSRAINNANKAGVDLIVIRLDTPGGLLDSTREMVRDILESEVPVAVYVAPEGAQAASAGTFIAAASGYLAMAPATNIGAAAVVGSGGEDLPETLSEKVTQDAAAFIRSIAEERGRNVDALVETVLEARAYSAAEAVDLDIADAMARDLDDLLTQLNGREVPAASGLVTVDTTGARITEVGLTFLDRVLEFLANPNLAFTLISLGTVALIVEFWNPGLWIPGTIGVVLLVLGFTGVGNLDFSWTGVIFIALAIALLLAEANAPGASFFGAAGAVSLVLGGVFLLGRFAEPDFQGARTVSIWVLTIAGGSILAFALWLAYQLSQMKKTPFYVSELAADALVGQTGTVTVALAPAGEVHVAGERWTAAAEGDRLEPGATVRVVEVHGLRLQVEEVEDDATDGEQS